MNISRCNFPTPLPPFLCQVCPEYWTFCVGNRDFDPCHRIPQLGSCLFFLLALLDVEKDLRSFILVFATLLGARALRPDFPFCWAGMFLLSSVHTVFQGKGTAPENNISLTGGLWVPGIWSILVSRPDRDGRGTESPVRLAEDVLHSLCQEPPAPLAPCPLSVPFLLLPFAQYPCLRCVCCQLPSPSLSFSAKRRPAGALLLAGSCLPASCPSVLVFQPAAAALSACLT